jgi:hypothetical protein
MNEGPVKVTLDEKILDTKSLKLALETPQETIVRLNGGWDRCREELMQTIKERDEARARADSFEKLVNLYGLLDDGSPVERAEARGYERGVREAAKVLENGWPAGAEAILALLDKPVDNAPDRAHSVDIETNGAL